MQFKSVDGITRAGATILRFLGASGARELVWKSAFRIRKDETDTAQQLGQRGLCREIGTQVRERISCLYLHNFNVIRFIE